MKYERRKLLVDRKVQGGLAIRQVRHWLTFLAVVVIMLPLYRAIFVCDVASPITERAKQAGVEALILLTLFLALLPYFVYDTVRLTNRFAGPVYRLHQTIRALGRGGIEA